MESKTLSRLIPFRITHYNFEKSSNANLQRIENFIQKFISFGDEVHLIDGDNEVELSFARNYRYTYLLHSTTIMFSHKVCFIVYFFYWIIYLFYLLFFILIFYIF